jgi:uncharacterized protein (TIGR02466 family)
MSEYQKDIFAIPLLIGRTNNLDICKRIEELAQKYRQEAKEARLVSDDWMEQKRSSNPEDIDKSGVTSYRTKSLIEDPEWADIAAFMYDFANEMINSVNPDKDKDKMLISDMWTTVYPKGAYIPEHTHANSLLSAVFYVRADEGCGDIEFRDPSFICKTMVLRGIGKFPSFNTRYREKPEIGKMLIFPSWLPHSTYPNKSDSDRIIISFNIDFGDADKYKEPK